MLYLLVCLSSFIDSKKQAAASDDVVTPTVRNAGEREAAESLQKMATGTNLAPDINGVDSVTLSPTDRDTNTVSTTDHSVPSAGSVVGSPNPNPDSVHFDSSTKEEKVNDTSPSGNADGMQVRRMLHLWKNPRFLI